VHGSGVHGGIRRDSWKAFHVVVPSGIAPRDWLLYPALLLRGQDGIFMDLSSCCRFGAGFRGHGDYRGAPMGACHCRRKASFAWWERLSAILLNTCCWLMCHGLKWNGAESWTFGRDVFLRIVGYTVSAKLGAFPAFKETFSWSPILVSLVEIFNCHLASFNVKLFITHFCNYSCSKEQPSMGGPMCECLSDMSYSSGVTIHNWQVTSMHFMLNAKKKKKSFSITYMEIPNSNNQQLLWLRLWCPVQICSIHSHHAGLKIHLAEIWKNNAEGNSCTHI
jgi:hypothetical protein